MRRLEYRESGALRVIQDGKAADRRNVLGGSHDFATQSLGRRHRRLDIGGTDVGQPLRFRPRGTRLIRQAHHAGVMGAADPELGVGRVDGGRLRTPADHLGIERGRSRGVLRHEFLPHKSTVKVSLCHGNSPLCA